MITYHIVGISGGLIYAPSVAILAQYFEEKRSLANGLALSGPVVGQFILSPLWVYFLESFSIRGAFILLSGCYLQITLFAALFRPLEFYHRAPRVDIDRERRTKEHTTTDGNSVETRKITTVGGEDRISVNKEKKFTLELTLFKNPFFTITFISCMFSFFCYRSFYLGLPPYLKDHGYSSASIALILSINAVSDFVGRILTGCLLNIERVKTNITVSMIYSVVTLITGVVVLLLGLDKPAWVVVSLSVVHGIIGGEIMTLLPLLLLEIVSKDKLGNAVGYFTLILNFGQALAPLLLGMIRHVFFYIF